jgi:hypothetical protein
VDAKTPCGSRVIGYESLRISWFRVQLSAGALSLIMDVFVF